MHIFAQAFPERFFQMGMAEQLLLGAAAGFAEAGLIPFASTYSVFATRRAYDFLCLDAAEPGLNVNVVGGLPGLTTGYGPSHQATEDIAIFRGIPGLTIVDPCDSVDIEQAVPQLAATPGPTYLRLLRGKVPTVLDEYDYTFELGKAKVLRPGRDVVLVSSGLMTMRALQAAERLAAHHVDVSVVHSPTIKPFDAATVLAEIDTDRLAAHLREPHRRRRTVRDRRRRRRPGRTRHGGSSPSRCPTQFLDAGALPTLHDRYGLATDRIVDRVLRAGRFLTLPHRRGGVADLQLSTDSCRRRRRDPEPAMTTIAATSLTGLDQDQPARAGAGLAADRHHQRADPTGVPDGRDRAVRSARHQPRHPPRSHATASARRSVGGPSRGRLFVRRLGPKEIGDIFAVRAALEALAASRLAGNEERTQIVAELRALLAVMDQAIGEGNLEQRIESDLAFHRALCRLTDNESLLHTWEGLEGSIRMSIMFAGHDRAVVNMDVARHDAIVDAIESGDPAAAVHCGARSTWPGRPATSPRSPAHAVASGARRRPPPRGVPIGLSWMET